MNSTFAAFLRSWPFDPWVLFGLLLTAAIYWRGWQTLHHRDAQRWTIGQLAAFMAGLSSLFLALASPIEPFAALLLQVHMLQHLLLMMIAPPLLWLGAPLFPLLRGLPQPIRTFWVGPFLRWRTLRHLAQALTHPVPALVIFTAAAWFWHLPKAYEIALSSSGWHYLQHACFFGAALLFWYPVIRPYPSRPRWSRWLLIPYLILADLQNTLLCALLTFSDRPFYAYYANGPRLGNLSPLEDQAAAGVLMWVPGSLAFLLPLFWIGVRLLYGDQGRRREYAIERGTSNIAPTKTRRVSLALIEQRRSPPAPDLLRVPLLGRLLRWRHARLAMQIPLLVAAGILIYDGLDGPQVSPMNLAGVVPWVHWRGLVVLALLVFGNVFCMACPFLASRTLARRWLPQGRSWPRWLRSKWLAVGLLAVFLWAYEALALWDSPWWTAWIAVGYFVAAFVIDGFFRGAAFCKYVCPIGQFNFVHSLVSPLEVTVRDPDLCTRCLTKDCIRGRDGMPGCELHLYQPRKAGNMDCTFCLDCVHVCPHDNIGMLAGLPGKDLWHDRFRSGVGRFSKRPDLAALVLVLVFGAFANAAGMVAPVLEWQGQLGSILGLQSRTLVTSLFYVFGLVVLPALTVGLSAAICRWSGQHQLSWLETATRFTYALIPLGFGMWLAHYSFHFLASLDAVTPALQRFAGDLGWPALDNPEWVCGCCRPVADWLPRLEILFLDLGLLVSLYSGYRIALALTNRPSQALKAFVPWAILLVLLFLAGVWIVLQPMQMRGTFLTAG
jgi:cytochrome c oxidase assembly factor CtaG